MKSKSDFAAPMNAATIQRFVDEGVLPVWLSHGVGKNLLYPDVKMADAITRPVSTPFPHFVQQGKDWRLRYENLLEPLLAKNWQLECQFVNYGEVVSIPIVTASPSGE